MISAVCEDKSLNVGFTKIPIFSSEEYQWQIRMLLILAGPDDSPVRCEMKTFCLVGNDMEDYIALSYTWGDLSQQSAIWIDGIEVNVGVNLSDALFRLRSFGVKLVWADAFCINQSDSQEKSFQLRYMKDIYRKAERPKEFMHGLDWTQMVSQHSPWTFYNPLE